VLIVCDLSIDRRASQKVHALGNRGLLPPLVLCGACKPAASVRHAWALAKHIDDFAADADALPTAVGRIVADNSSSRILSYLRKQLEISEPIVHSLLDLLASNSDSLTWSVARVAQAVGVSKSTLYDALNREGAPTVSRWQMLFRLLEACALLQRGASSNDAAYLVHLADERSLRRGLDHYLATTLAEVRRTKGWRWLVDRWINQYSGASAAVE